MGCLSVIFERVGSLVTSIARIGSAALSATHIPGEPAVKFSKIGYALTSSERVGATAVRVGLVCSIDLFANGILWASDGKLFTLEGGYLIPAQ